VKNVKRLIRWASVLGLSALTAVALAQPGLDTELDTWVSPGTDAKVDLGETLDITLHLEGNAGDQVDVTVAASSGAVDPASGSVTLNPQGKAAFDVVYTPAEVGDHTVTFSSDAFDDVVVDVEVNPAEEPGEELEELESEPEVAATGPNHGQCVAGWVHRAKAEGLEKELFGEFVSTVAGDKTAVAESKDEIIEGNAPGTCDFADLLAEKLQEQADSADVEDAESSDSEGKGKGKGKPDVEEVEEEQATTGS
jgi:hypothetical protein